jgi:hypothetical protein
MLKNFLLWKQFPMQYKANMAWMVLNLKLTFISYSFWNIRRKVLKFYKFDEKRAITPRWTIRFVVRRKLFQKSSPLKVQDQWKPNLVWIITMVSSFKIVSGDAVHQPTWPLLLKIEHMVNIWWKKGNNSNMGTQIYFIIAGYEDLAVLIIFTECQISDIINGFWVITQKPANLPYVLFCSLFNVLLSIWQGVVWQYKCRIHLFSSPGQRPSELLPSLGIRRTS